MPDRPKRFRPIGAPPPGRRKDTRPSAAKRGYDARWQRARLAYLAKHPLCVYCEARGRKVAANTVDHIVAHKGDRKLFWDMNNWAASCGPCNSRKAAKHEGGFGHAQK
ncbi:MAG TPA: HNH endonuclease [Marinobacter sp.]|nr:HNH endonuclease [Marinobacter sp.]